MFREYAEAIRELNKKFENTFEFTKTLDLLMLINQQCTGSGNSEKTQYVRALAYRDFKVKFKFLKNICILNQVLCIHADSVEFKKESHAEMRPDGSVTTSLVDSRSDNNDQVVFDRDYDFVDEIVRIVEAEKDGKFRGTYPNVSTRYLLKHITELHQDKFNQYLSSIS